MTPDDAHKLAALREYEQALLAELDTLIHNLTLAGEGSRVMADACDEAARLMRTHRDEPPDVADARMTNATRILSAALEQERAIRQRLLADRERQP